jgi:superfamily II DNA helicase RecQ
MLLIGRGKSLLFIAPAYLIDLGVTIVIVLYCILLDNLLKTVKDVRINCIKYRPREQNPTALVSVSIDFARRSQFLSYI